MSFAFYRTCLLRYGNHNAQNSEELSLFMHDAYKIIQPVFHILSSCSKKFQNIVYVLSFVAFQFFQCQLKLVFQGTLLRLFISASVSFLMVFSVRFSLIYSFPTYYFHHLTISSLLSNIFPLSSIIVLLLFLLSLKKSFTDL